METFYAAIDTGNITGAVYGVGETEEAAVEDAREWGAEGRFRVVPCTPAAYRHVRANGGAPQVEVEVTARGVRMADEEGGR